jgi:hypothetical protein
MRAGYLLFAEVLLPIYFIGIIGILLVNLSYLIFAKVSLWQRIKALLSVLWWVFIWPLTIFSDDGRKRLFVSFENI